MWWLVMLIGTAAMRGKSRSSSSSSSSAPVDASERARMIALIRKTAERFGVPADVALATARVESNFNPRAEGDVRWHELDGGARYRQHVLGNSTFARNPWREDARRWHSYGLFQLLAPYHTLPQEDPRALLDPQINALRGVALLARLGKRAEGDWNQVRLLYTGATRADLKKQATILAKFQRARKEFET